MITFAIFNNTPCEIYSIYSIAFSFEVSKLKSKQFLHQFFFELNDIFQRVRTFILEHTLGHSFACIVILVFAGIKLS